MKSEPGHIHYQNQAFKKHSYSHRLSGAPFQRNCLTRQMHFVYPVSRLAKWICKLHVVIMQMYFNPQTSQYKTLIRQHLDLLETMGGTKVRAHTSDNTLRLCSLLSQPVVTWGASVLPLPWNRHTHKCHRSPSKSRICLWVEWQGRHFSSLQITESYFLQGSLSNLQASSRFIC